MENMGAPPPAPLGNGGVVAIDGCCRLSQDLLLPLLEESSAATVGGSNPEAGGSDSLGLDGLMDDGGVVDI